MMGKFFICLKIYYVQICIYKFVYVYLLRNTSDVKHAASYVEERSTANVLADQFFE